MSPTSFTTSPRVFRAAALPDDAPAPVPLDPAKVVSGDPQVHHLGLVDTDVAVGIWQHSPGTSTDVEAEEVFVVLTGRATIDCAGGPTLEVSPGDVVLLRAGTATTWTVHETLRKVYLLRP
jgi:uncharacterized protein